MREELAREPYTTLLTEDRQVTGELLYYLRDIPVPLRTWRRSTVPNDHFELTRPFAGGGNPILLVTLRSDIEPLAAQFGSSRRVHEYTVSAGPMRSRTVRLYRLDAFEGTTS